MRRDRWHSFCNFRSVQLWIYSLPIIALVSVSSMQETAMEKARTFVSQHLALIGFHLRAFMMTCEAAISVRANYTSLRFRVVPRFRFLSSVLKLVAKKLCLGAGSRARGLTQRNASIRLRERGRTLPCISEVEVHLFTLRWLDNRSLSWQLLVQNKRLLNSYDKSSTIT
jgi:hypothetical protein